MPGEVKLEVFRALREGQNKYVYFLLAAAGTVIGLVVRQTESATFVWTQLPLGIAVLCWGLSFFYGCLHLSYANATLYANAELLRIQEGTEPETRADLGLIAAASEGIQAAIETNSSRASRYGSFQFGLLIVGAVFYLVWHILEMYVRTVSQTV